MRRALLAALLVASVFAVGCGEAVIDPAQSLRPADFLYHKNTIYIKVHWKITSPDKETVVAEGFVEPFDYSTGIYGVRLELVGLDGNGEVVNAAEGRPRDTYIASPLEKSPFTITMKLNGREKKFTIRGEYYQHGFGTSRDFSGENFDTIPLSSDEPY